MVITTLRSMCSFLLLLQCYENLLITLKFYSCFSEKLFQYMLTYYMFTKQNNLYKLWLPFFPIYCQVMVKFVSQRNGSTSTWGQNHQKATPGWIIPYTIKQRKLFGLITFLCSLVYTIKPYKRSIPYYTIKDVIFYSQIGSSPSDTTGRNHEILGDLSNRKRGFHRQKWTFKLFNNGCDLFG